MRFPKLLFLIVFPFVSFTQQVDASFLPEITGGATVFAFDIQDDGKIVMIGDFIKIDGHFVSDLVRINSDGTLDQDLDFEIVGIRIDDLAVQEDGKILLAGAGPGFLGGETLLKRLDPDGEDDEGFVPEFQVLGSSLHQVLLLEDGKILVGGLNGVERLLPDGKNDESFSIPEIDGRVNSMKLLPGGDIIIGGFFESINGEPVNSIARLHANGTIDDTFNVGIGPDRPIGEIEIQEDGKIYVVGIFDEFNGDPSEKIIRLNPDGSFDDSFTMGYSAHYSVSQCEIQSDGKLVISGFFGNSANRIIRLNNDGAVDFSFTNTVDALVEELVLLDDGKILAGGSFINAGATIQPGFARFFADGSLDTSTNANVEGLPEINVIEIQDDGKVLVGGEFVKVDGTTAVRIARLNTDGSVDSGFNAGTGADEPVFAIKQQADGKILIGGEFYTIDEASRDGIARLNPDGSLDTEFSPTLVRTGGLSVIYEFILQPDQKIIAAGEFTEVNSVDIDHLARLNHDGSLDATFNTGNVLTFPVRDIEPLENGNFYVVGNLLNEHGSFVPLGANANVIAGFGASSLDFASCIETVKAQSDGKFYIGVCANAFDQSEEIKDKILFRFNADGTLDTSFEMPEGFGFTDLLLLDDDRILGGGNTEIRIFDQTGETSPKLSWKFEGIVDKLFRHGDDLYVSGEMSKAGSERVFGIAKISLNLQSPPTASGFNASIDEGTEVGTEIGAISASDPDGDILTYSIVSGNDDEFFSIELDGGVVLNMQPEIEESTTFDLTIEVADINWAVTTSASVEIRALGLDDYQLRFYPNPALNKITLSGIATNHNQFSLFTISGKQLPIKYSQRDNDYVFDIADLKKGIYLIKFASEDKIRTFRFIK